MFGILQNYWYQNTDREDFIKISRDFFNRLIRRGHDPTSLRELFKEAAEKLDKISPRDSQARKLQESEENQLYFQIEYHSKCISRMQIRNAYEECCENPTEKYKSEGFKNLATKFGENMKIDRMTVCYHRAKNIRDTIIPSKVFETDNIKVSKIHEEMKR